MTDEPSEPKKPKIVSMHNRKEYIAPPEPPKPGEVDENSVKLLETFLEEAMAGKLCGVCIVGFDPMNKVPRSGVCLPMGEDVRSAGLRTVGALDLLKSHILDVSMGLYEAVDEEEFEEDEGDDEG